jgi:hypothetical protein
MRPGGAKDVQVNIAQDPKEPGLEVRPGLKAPPRGEGASDRLLGQVPTI